MEKPSERDPEGSAQAGGGTVNRIIPDIPHIGSPHLMTVGVAADTGDQVILQHIFRGLLHSVTKSSQDASPVQLKAAAGGQPVVKKFWIILNHKVSLRMGDQRYSPPDPDIFQPGFYPGPGSVKGELHQIIGAKIDTVYHTGIHQPAQIIRCHNLHARKDMDPDSPFINLLL